MKDSRLDHCFYAESLQYPHANLDFQIIDHKVAVISTQDSKYASYTGVKVGDIEQRIYQLHPQEKFEKVINPYGDFKHQYSILYGYDTKKSQGIRYDVDDDKVTEIYLGNQNLEPMEGCA